jgi:hypothetical protein
MVPSRSGGSAFAHVQQALRPAHAVLRLAPAVRANLGCEPRELEPVGRLDGRGVAARIHALAAQAAGLDELAGEAGLGEARAVGAERRERSSERGQGTRAGRSCAGVIDEWAHHMEHRRSAVRA